jgi:chromosome partitioning protein
MNVLAVAGLKGGVGKTTTAVNLAWIASRSGARTLVVDLDPQGAASWLLRVQSGVRGGAKDLVKGRTDAAGAIKATDFQNLFLLPADLSFRNLDRRLDDQPRRRQRLARILAPLGTEFDRIVIDAPPGLGLLVENVLRAADCVLLPTLPTQLSLNAAAQVLRFVAERVDEHQAPPCHAFFTFVDRRRAAHRAMVDGDTRPLPGMLDTVVHYSADIEQMIEQRAPLPAINPRSRASAAYHALWEEIVQRMNPSGRIRQGV